MITLTSEILLDDCGKEKSMDFSPRSITLRRQN